MILAGFKASQLLMTLIFSLPGKQDHIEGRAEGALCHGYLLQCDNTRGPGTDQLHHLPPG